MCEIKTLSNLNSIYDISSRSYLSHKQLFIQHVCICVKSKGNKHWLNVLTNVYACGILIPVSEQIQFDFFGCYI